MVSPVEDGMSLVELAIARGSKLLNFLKNIRNER